ncbi:hypothetical protein TSUD_243680 [Trifolium subterraneum]|uniref:Uncharacterized protein n=1 Tax=Trifolium subterraneum TaxID=3900 RepID=A0A2Z6NL47_TRISU|nr:hypothetical protein TSUD_243680 [Trifolium subterraneum]
MEIHGVDVVREMEEEEMEREADEDKTILLEYGSMPHIARSVYDYKDREMIMTVSNGGK